jgi:hypothetical protein
MTIKQKPLCFEHANELAEGGEYVELKQCDCTGWEHVFGKDFSRDDGYGCPGPIEPDPNECCGTLDSLDVTRPCSKGYCVEFFCGGCGTYRNSGYGPVGCGCAQDSGHWTHAERRMLHVPNGSRYHRRIKARAKR